MSSPFLQNLSRDIELRHITDTQVSVFWVLLPLLGTLGILFLSAMLLSQVAALTATSFSAPTFAPSGLFSQIALFSLFLDILFVYFFYLLIRRRNNHFRRQQRFFTDLAQLLRGIASSKGVNIEAFLGSMEGTERQAQIDETEKSAVLWSVLLIVPLLDVVALLYILYFLTRDYYRHERREDEMLTDSARALSALGVQLTFNRNSELPHRSFILYLILDLVTFGLFGIYWQYVLIRDPNTHFMNHRLFEDQILQLVTPLVV